MRIARKRRGTTEKDELLREKDEVLREKDEVLREKDEVLREIIKYSHFNDKVVIMSINQHNKSDILKKSFYLTSLFADIKSETGWTTNEIKTILVLFSKMSDYRVYLPDLDDNDSLSTIMKKIPNKYDITKDEFISVTGVRLDNSVREINKVRKKLGSKIINTPHPLDNSDESGETIPWFTKISYSNVKSLLTLELNLNALERLVAFVKYSKINFEHITKLKSSYSIYTYLFLKVLKDISFNSSLKSETLDIQEFKQRLNLTGKYNNSADFRKHVLDVIKKEINSYTDLDIDFSLVKRGRSYKKIVIDFEYKDHKLLRDDVQYHAKNSENLFGFNVDMIVNNDDFASPFETKLVSWGIRAKKVVQIESEYSLDAISKAIGETEKADLEGSIKSTKAAFFMGVLENKEFESQKLFEEQRKKAIEEQQMLEKRLLGEEYDAIQSFIHQNETEISSYLSAKSMGAIFELSEDIKVELGNLRNIDSNKFKGFRSRLPVLFDGYFDMKEKKNISPNMHNFLKIIKL